MLAGFTDATLPPVLGYVMARPKPTAQVLLSLESGDPYLAVGRYGTGMGVCCTADLTERWSSEWLTWGGCGKFWAQILRGILKRADATGIEARTTLEQDQLSLQIRRTDEAGRPLSDIRWQPYALDENGKEREVKVSETGIGRYAVNVSLKDAEALTFRLNDTEYGKVKFLQWLRPYPAEYRLSTKIDPALNTLPNFSVEEIKQGLPAVSIRSSLIPLLCFIAIGFLIAGLVLRRV
jgi:hypothetical protein